MNNLNNIQELLRKKADLQTRLSLIAYTGTPEIKENKSGKYLYMRKRELGRLTSQYVDKFSDELYQTLLRYSKEARELNKSIRQIEKELTMLGYVSNELLPEVQLNLDFARANMKANIYDQAILEGVATTYPQTETIIENGKVSGMRASDVQKILNLKHAWEFIMDKDVIQVKTDFYILSYIAGLVNEGFYEQGGRIRGVPVAIGGSNYVPPIPNEIDIKESINNILSSNASNIDKAIELCLYCMKTQIFNDGNKRASVIFANHYLISQGGGLIVIPEKEVPEFKRLLVDYYEDKDTSTIKTFMKEKCWKKFK
ncbi:MAG: cell filamentation protein Fic [Clostridia bacterium]|jgi:Fic family protein|nr:cell filamentation protein Fic [Clostridia bacterium]